MKLFSKGHSWFGVYLITATLTLLGVQFVMQALKHRAWDWSGYGLVFVAFFGWISWRALDSSVDYMVLEAMSERNRTDPQP